MINPLLVIPAVMVVGSLSLFVISLLARPKAATPTRVAPKEPPIDRQQLKLVYFGLLAVAVIVFLPLVVQALPAPHLGTLRSQLDAARADVDRLGKELTTMQQDLISARQAASDAEAKVAPLQQALSEERQKTVAAQTQIDQLQVALKKAQESSQASSARAEDLSRQVASIQQELATVEGKNQALTTEVQFLKSSSEVLQSLRPSLDLVTKYTPQQFVEATQNSNIKKAILRAFQLKDQGVAFAWYGRDPTTGLDSFGFVKQVLQAGGVSTLLNASDLIAASGILKRADKPQIGDIIVYKGNHAMIYLSQGRAIGMTPLGIAVEKVDSAPQPEYVLRVPYPSGR